MTDIIIPDGYSRWIGIKKGSVEIKNIMGSSKAEDGKPFSLQVVTGSLVTEKHQGCVLWHPEDFKKWVVEFKASCVSHIPKPDPYHPIYPAIKHSAVPSSCKKSYPPKKAKPQVCVSCGATHIQTKHHLTPTCERNGKKYPKAKEWVWLCSKEHKLIHRKATNLQIATWFNTEHAVRLLLAS